MFGKTKPKSDFFALCSPESAKLPQIQHFALESLSLKEQNSDTCTLSIVRRGAHLPYDRRGFSVGN